MALISAFHKLQTDRLKESAKAVTKHLANQKKTTFSFQELVNLEYN